MFDIGLKFNPFHHLTFSVGQLIRHRTLTSYPFFAPNRPVCSVLFLKTINPMKCLPPDIIRNLTGLRFDQTDSGTRLTNIRLSLKHCLMGSHLNRVDHST